MQLSHRRSKNFIFKFFLKFLTEFKLFDQKSGRESDGLAVGRVILSVHFLDYLAANFVLNVNEPF